MKILVINPGATSTKICVFEDEEEVMRVGIDHDAAEIAKYPHVVDQAPFRKAAILETIEKNGYKLEDFDAICRSGQPVTLQPGRGFRKGKSATFVKDGLAVTTTLKGFPTTVQARFRSGDGFSAQAAYVGRTKAKRIDLTGFLRFHRWNPAAPKDGK